MSLDISLYVVTGRGLSRRPGHLGVARWAAAGGGDIIQLRDKELSRARRCG